MNTDPRQGLASHLREQRSWFEQRLEREPEDDAAERAVASLGGLLAHVAALPEDDARLAMLAGLDPYGALPLLPEQEASTVLADVAQGVADPDAWLDAFVAAYARDWGGGFTEM